MMQSPEHEQMKRSRDETETWYLDRRYVIRLHYKRGGKRHTQFIEINADSLEDAEALLRDMPAIGRVQGTVRECEDQAAEHAKRCRPPTDEELEWAKSVARDRGLI